MSELVSIITPSFNTEIFIEETIRSVLNQTHENWEMIIVDDFSSDKSVDIINSYKDNRIKLFVNDTNKGAAYSRNYAINQAKGKWIAFLDSDDLWHPLKLEEQVKFMKKNNYHFTYTNYFEIDEKSVPNGKQVTGPTILTKQSQYNFCYQGCLTVMYNREVIGLIQIKDLSKNNDYALWLKIIKKSNCYLLDNTLASYRKREGSISNHSYFKLIKYHFYLWKYGEGKNTISAIVFTIRNLIFGALKKIMYVRRISN